MDKKEFILNILNVTKDSRDMAPWLQALLQNNVLDDSVIDDLVLAFREAAAKTQNIKEKQALEKWATMLQDIHTKEAVEQENDLADLAELEQMFKNM